MTKKLLSYIGVYFFTLFLFLIYLHGDVHAASSVDLVPALSLTSDWKQAIFSVKNTGDTPIKLTTSNFSIEYGWQNPSGIILWKSTVKINDSDWWSFWQSDKTLKKEDPGLFFHRDITLINGASQFYIKVDSGNQITESNEDNNLKTLIFGVTDLKPVLTLSQDKKTAEFSVINVGGLPIKLTTSNFLIEYGWRVQWGAILNSWTVKINDSDLWPFWQSETVLSPNTTGLHFHRNVAPPDFAAEFYVKVDSGNQITEAQENNNEAKVTFGLPDLKGALNFSPDSNLRTLKVLNVHIIPVTLTLNNFLLEYGWMDKDGKSLSSSTLKISDADGWGSWGTAKSLVAGDGGLVFHHAFPSPPNGASQEYIKVDSGNQITEANELNNVATLTSAGTITPTVVQSVPASPTPTPSPTPRPNYIMKRSRPTQSPTPTPILKSPSLIIESIKKILGGLGTIIPVKQKQPVPAVPIPTVQRPDLIVDSVTVTRVNPTATVKNIGKAEVRLAGSQGVLVIPPKASGSWLDGSGATIGDQTTVSLGGAFGPQSLGINSTMQLTFQTTAPQNAKAFRVKVDSASQIQEEDEGNNEKTENLLPPDLPDLTVESITANRTNPTAMIKNLGKGTVRLIGSGGVLVVPPKVSGSWIDVNGTTIGSPTIVSLGGGFGPGSLTSGQAMQITFSDGAPQNAKAFKVKVDSDSQITESNEGNNEKTQDLPSPDLPDLTVDSLIVTRVNPIATVKNIGKADVRLSGSQGVLVIPPKASGSWLDGSDAPIGDQTTVSLGGAFGPQSLTVGNSIQITFPTGAPQNAKAFRVKVDSLSQITESNEGNNEKTENLPLPDLPDLTVESINLSGNNPTTVIKNIGKAEVRLAGSGGVLVIPPKAAGSWLDANGATIGSPTIASLGAAFGPSSLNAGSSLNLTFQTTAPQNAKAFRVKVDSASQIQEEDESNNELEAPVITKDTKAQDLIKYDEDKIAKQIGEKQILLPGTLQYFFKDFGRGFQSLITQNPEKKVALYNKFAKEKILEADALADQGKLDKAIEHLVSFSKDIDTAQKLSQGLKNKKPDVFENITAKTLEEQLRYQLLLNKFERLSPKNKLIDIQKIQAESIKILVKDMSSIDDKDKIKSSIVKSLNKNGSPFQSLRNAEVFKNIEKNVPEDIKKILSDEEQNSINSFKSYFKNLPKDQKQLFIEYVKLVGGEDEEFKRVVEESKPAEPRQPEPEIDLNNSSLDLPAEYQQYLEELKQSFGGKIPQTKKEVREWFIKNYGFDPYELPQQLPEQPSNDSE